MTKFVFSHNLYCEYSECTQQTIGSCYSDYLKNILLSFMFASVTVDITDPELKQWVLNVCSFGIKNGMWIDSDSGSNTRFEMFKQYCGIPEALLSMQDQLCNPSD